jgi:type I restriction enzyme S subunit
MSVPSLITQHLDVWTSVIETRSTAGRGSSNKLNIYGIKKLRELILELAVRGQLVPQNPNDEPASVLLEKISAEKARLIKDGKLKKQEPLPPITDDEKPFELPKGWEWARLGNIAEINPRNKTEDDVPASFIPMPLISTAYDGRHDHELRNWGEIKKGYTHFAEGDIAVAKITPCFENSKAAIFRDLKNGIGAGTTELHVARPFGNTLAPNYILLYLKAPMFLVVGETKMTGTAGQKRLPKDFFESNPLPLPPLAEQHRIVAKVNELMSLCDALEQEQAANIAAHQTLVEELLAALTQNEGYSWARISTHFDTLFTTEHSIDTLSRKIISLAARGMLTSSEPLSADLKISIFEKAFLDKNSLISSGKAKEEKINPLNIEMPCSVVPSGWIVCKLHDVTVCLDHKRDPVKKSNRCGGDIPYYGANGAVGYIDDFLFDDELVLVVEDETFIGRIKPFSYRISGKSWVNNHAHVLKCTSVILPDFLNILLSYYPFIPLTSGTTGRKKLTKNTLLQIPIMLPPLAEQHCIVAKVDELMALCDAMKAQLKTAQTTQSQLADVLASQIIGAGDV